MDLPRGLSDKIDDYVSDALDATGTRKTRQARRIPTPLPVKTPVTEDIDIDVSDMSADSADDAAATEPSDGLIPVEIDDQTDPEGRNIFSFDEGTAFLAPAFKAPNDPIPTLSRIRTARGSQPPPAEIELDEDEITNVLGIPQNSR